MTSGLSDVFAVAQIGENGQAARFSAILVQARDAMCAQLDDAIADMLDKADDALLAFINESRNLSERRGYEEARAVAAEKRATLEAHFQEQYFEEFERRCNRARKFGDPFNETEVSSDCLELVETEDLDETLQFNAMANKLRAYCDDELVALDQRVGVLLGDANLKSSDNPFSPQAICDCYKHACRELDVDLRVRQVFLKLFDDHVLDDVRAVYKTINSLLVRNSILPKIRYNVARDKDREKPTPAEETQAETPALSALPVAPQDLFSILQKLVGTSSAPVAHLDAGAATGGAAGGASEGGSDQGALAKSAGVVTLLQGAELIGSLTRIQRGDLSAVSGGNLNARAQDPGTNNILRELKGTSLGAGMNQLDALTLDIVAMLFDQLFDDPKIPNGVKALIGRLQIPVLKVAIADKSFFSGKAHPTRQLLDAVGELAARLPADFGAASPLFAPLQALLQDVVEGFQENLEVFTTARERLHALLAEEDRRIEEQTKAEAKRLEDMENLALAKSVAQQEIKARVLTQKPPLAVVEFLAQQWIKLLILIHVKEGSSGDSWTGALKVVDQLLWSVSPKGSAEDRSKLTALIPKLIKNLAAGMKSAGIDDGIRDRFFAELMKHHTQAMSGTGQAQPRAAESAQEAPSFSAGVRGANPSRPGARPAANRSLDFSAPVTVRNPFGAGEVDVDSQDLDFTDTQNIARARREESIRRALDSLGMGTWVEFGDPEDPHKRRPARLIFVSPRKTRYLFAVDRAGKEVFQCTRGEISRRLRIGEAVKLEHPPEESLFDRIMNALLGKLRAPGRAALFST